MYDNYNYPMGADTPDAPWNQRDPEPATVDVVVEQSFCRSVRIETTNYTEDADGDREFDNLKEAYSEQAYTPADLLAKFIDILVDIKHGDKPKVSKSEVEYLISECDNWLESVDEDSVTEA